VARPDGSCDGVDLAGTGSSALAAREPAIAAETTIRPESVILIRGFMTSTPGSGESDADRQRRNGRRRLRYPITGETNNSAAAG
jgi:hypothetical protein